MIAAPARGYARYVLAMLTVAYTFNYLDRYVLTIVAQDVKRELALSDSQLGFLMGPAFAVIYTGLGIPVAWLADRISRRNILAVAFFAWSLFTAACGMARSAAELAFWRVMVGVGEAGGNAPSQSLISDYFPRERRATAFAVFQIGVFLGQFLGLAGGGLLVQALGWRETFVWVGLAGAPFALLLVATVREPVRGAQEAHALAAPAPFAETARWLRSSATFRRLALGAGLASFAGTGFGFWVPTLLQRVHGVGPAQVGPEYGLVNTIAGAGGALLVARLADGLGRRDPRWLLRVCAASVALSLPFLCAICLWPTYRGAILLGIPSGLLGGGWAPIAYAVGQSLVPANMRALTASFLVLAITLLGLGGGPWAVGVLSDLYAARFGDDAIRVALVTVLAASAVGAVSLALGVRSVRDDLAKAEGR